MKKFGLKLVALAVLGAAGVAMMPEVKIQIVQPQAVACDLNTGAGCV